MNLISRLYVQNTDGTSNGMFRIFSFIETDSMAWNTFHIGGGAY